MITLKNLFVFLNALDFQPVHDGIYMKHFVDQDCDIIVDSHKKEITYPENKGFVVNERQTCNFSKNENFVVLECVVRLLHKGYYPQDIELEPKWKLGHGASGGRADIWVRTIDSNGDKHSLLIIECKTPGSEFYGAWEDTLYDGDQLFSYFQQEKETKFLCLYTSDYSDSVSFEYKLINVVDNDELISNLKNPKTYKASSNNKQLFTTWKETYQQDVATVGLFEKDIAAYDIGKNNYSLDDLHEVDEVAINKKYHEFATILRQHNISGHENAFDKLVNLFLAKVVDETNNPDNLSFYWKGAAYDDPFRLQDRLQKLYKIGMERFLNEDVTYIDNSDIVDAFRLFKKDPDSTKEAILEYFRQLKFFTNNDFAFIDVHNEHLFYQNAEVLRKVVIMLEDIKLKTETQNQFLGDLFEGFLDQGVKQSEGQYFTPIPIVRFIISSLPLQTIINESDGAPKVIDYACGAGHFLNEYAQQIKTYISERELFKYYEAITGIEKEYRLSKVAKVSAFMYGQDEINIIYADALSKQAKVKNGAYSLLIANPPYSVKGFLGTLSEEERSKYSLFSEVSDLVKNNSIEVFFVERAIQLLAPGGYAAIILPSTILSKGGIYSKCRELILKYMDIIAINEFGSGTFGKTGTNTVTLFMRRKQRNPEIADHYENRINSWFSDDFEKDKVFDDFYLIESYCVHMEYDINDYITLFSGEPNEGLLKTDMFTEYYESFIKSSSTKKIINRKVTAKYTEEDKQKALDAAFIEYCKKIEKDKLFYFILAFLNPRKVIVTVSPDKKEIKKFLGYEWSGTKGNEGLKTLGTQVSDDDELSKNRGLSQIKTPLYNPQNLFDADKINTIIRENFLGNEISIPSNLEELVSEQRLQDMLEFGRVEFDKSIRLSGIKKIEIPSKYDSEKLFKLSTLLARGKTPEYGDSSVQVIKSGQARGYYEFDFSEKVFLAASESIDERKLCKGDVLINSTGVGTVGRVTLFDLDGDYVADNHITIFRANERVLPEYVLDILSVAIGFKTLEKMADGASGQIELAKDTIKNIKIPVPPKGIQENIVKEIKKIDILYQDAINKINSLVKDISDIFSELQESTSPNQRKKFKLSDKNCFSLEIGRRVLSTEIIDGGKYPVISANVNDVFGYIDKELISDFSRPSVLWGIDGDWLVCYRQENEPFYPTDHCGYLRVLTKDINARYMAWLLEQEGKRVKFSRSYRSSIDRVEGLSVEVPDIKNQNEAVQKVRLIEDKISTEKEKLIGLDNQKHSILFGYLQ